MSRTSDGGRYFSCTEDGFEGAPMIEVYAGQIMASLCATHFKGLNIASPILVPFMQEHGADLAKVSVLLARALLVELGYPTQEVEKAEKARERAAIREEVCREEGLDKERDGMDPHEIDL
jgi:hypothetical protein